MEQQIFTADEIKKGTGPFKKKKSKAEENVQIKVCNYLRKAYPAIIFTCDLSSGMKLPIHIAAKNKQMRSSRGLPDLFIAKPVKFYSKPLGAEHRPYRYFQHFFGLFLELKNADVVIYNRDGSLRKDPHLYEQNEILKSLEKEGYKAVFACGFDEAKKIIDEYLQAQK